MSWRIEHADALTLLRELPDNWAQTCVTSPPRDLPVHYLLAMLSEVHRVLRDDGTLWLALPGRGNSPRLARSIEEEGWLRPEYPRAVLAAHRAARSCGAVLLFTKQPRFLFNQRRAIPASYSHDAGRCALHPRSPRPNRACGRPHSRRRAWCVRSGAAAGVRPEAVIEWCILSSTLPRACRVCGTPWQRVPATARREASWRAACEHGNGRGRCLVLDPFCRSGAAGVIAQRLGRDFLGVEHNAATARLARRRLTAAHEERER
jgi:hypothetical protein